MAVFVYQGEFCSKKVIDFVFFSLQYGWFYVIMIIVKNWGDMPLFLGVKIWQS